MWHVCLQLSVQALKTGTPYFAENDFRRQVLRRSTQRPGPAFYSLGKSKVCHLEVRSTYSIHECKIVTQHYILILCAVAHLDVAVVVNEKVLRFQIPVYEV